jgi:hypothetical protein
VAVQEGLPFGVDLVGRTDGTGPVRTNARLSGARADWVLSASQARSVRGVEVAVVGVRASRPLRSEENDGERAEDRSTTSVVRHEGTAARPRGSSSRARPPATPWSGSSTIPWA